jgi:hypothetical protein
VSEGSPPRGQRGDTAPQPPPRLNQRGDSMSSVGGVELFIVIVIAIVVAGLVLRQIMSKR